MINEKELLINNKSYINKDFATIYPELLSLIKYYTNKWNPQSSNESDPGIVLLKTGGFLGDKLNYNIDKNILEAFVLSNTQESSMRKNTSVLGYDMKYYQSATVDVQFSYIGDKLDVTSASSPSKSFVIPKFTSITSEDGEIQYVLTEDVTISAKGSIYSKLAIEGKKETLEVGDSDVIQLENIDSNFRIYFPIRNIASNGIFVCNVDDEGNDWENVSNLNLCPSETKCFKFGYDSSRSLPYIEFPDDISKIIGNGLTINYIVSSGVDGNIGARYLTKLSGQVDFAIKNSDETLSFGGEEGNDTLIIRNLSASFNGRNPETINEAYNNFKKTIGTFDTLVTCRDYANAIYNMYNDDYPLVSTCQVCDRRDDINYGTPIVSYDVFGQKFINTKNSKNSDVEAFDLFLYPLNPISQFDVEGKGFKNSFKPLVYTDGIKDTLENNYKSISHDYYTIKDNDIYAIKNYLKLNAKIYTKYKVNDYERLSIIQNVILALITNFNARNVDYGYEIPYDAILDTIVNADERINNCSLEEPKLSTKVMFGNGNEEALISSGGLDALLSIIATNILRGRVSLFDYYDKFDLDFGQQNLTTLDNLKTISTSTSIVLSKSNPNSEVELLDNEVVQFIGPSFVTDTSYVANVLYRYTGGSGIIPKNTYYKLSGNEALGFWFKKSSSEPEKYVVYGEGTIIKSTFDIKNIDDLVNETDSTKRVVTTQKLINNENLDFARIDSQDTINIVKYNKVKLGNPTYVYWLRNTTNNSLFLESEKVLDEDDNFLYYETILNDNEYVFYTDNAFTNLVSLGSGTTIRCNILNASDWTRDIVEVSDILEDGLLALREKWGKIINLTFNSVNTGGTYLEIQENQIITTTSGDRIAYTGDDTITLGNNLEPLTNEQSQNILYNDTPLEIYDLDDATWKVKSRLDLNTSKDYSQRIDSTRQQIIFTDKDGSPLTIGGTISPYGEGTLFNLNILRQLIGGSSIDVSSVNIVTNEPTYPVSVAVYKVQTVDGQVKKLERDINGYASITIKDGEGFSYSVPSISNKSSLLMIYVSGLINNSATITCTRSNQNYGIRLFNASNTNPWGSSLTITEDGIYNIEMREVSNLSITTTSTDQVVVNLSKIKFISGLNSVFNFEDGLNIDGESKSTLEEKLLQKLRALDSENKFYYAYDLSNAKAIETNDLTSPLAFYDANNVANKMTISQIDLDDILNDIIIVRSSRL